MKYGRCHDSSEVIKQLCFLRDEHRDSLKDALDWEWWDIVHTNIRHQLTKSIHYELWTQTTRSFMIIKDRI